MNIFFIGGMCGIGVVIVIWLFDYNVFVIGSVDGDFVDLVIFGKFWVVVFDWFDGWIDVLINNVGIFEVMFIDVVDIEWLVGWVCMM